MTSQIVVGWTLPVLCESTLVLVNVVVIGTSEEIRRTDGQSWNGG